MKFFNPALAVVFTTALLCCGCSNQASISGRFTGLADHTVLLEQVTANGIMPLDSVKTDSRGNFKLKIKPTVDSPTLYNLRIEGRNIPLFVSPSDNIKVTSLFGNTRDYQVEGSAESSLLKEVNDILWRGTSRLDSISNARSLYEPDPTSRQQGLKEFAAEYNRVKREQIVFIIRNSGSLAAIYALSQRLPGDQTLSNGQNDIVYYRMVADSVAKNYPDSPYLKALKSAIESADTTGELIKMLNDSTANPISYPDLDLPDIYGNKHRLSESDGKLILVDFWLPSASGAAVANAELKELYNEFFDRGLVIFQVGLDESKPAWVNAVQQQKLPWISVSDMKGLDGTAPRLYNVSKVPSNYLISQSGEIVSRDNYGSDLRDQILKYIQ